MSTYPPTNTTTRRTNYMDEFLAAGLDEVFEVSFKGEDDQYKEFMKVTEAGKGGQVKDFQFLGFTAASVISNPKKDATLGTGAITFEKLAAKPGSIYTPIEIGKGFAVGKRLRDDEMYGIITTAAGKLGQSLKVLIEQMAVAVLQNGTTNGLFSDNHALVGTASSTYDNLITTAMSKTSLAEMFKIIRKTPNERNLPAPIIGKIKLIVPADIYIDTLEILKSTLVADSSDNTKNVLPAVGFGEIVVNDYVDDTNNYYAIAQMPGLTNLKMIWWEHINTGSEIDFQSRCLQYGAWAALDVGWSDWRGTVGAVV